MDLPFEHTRSVNGQGFLAREAELRELRSSIRAGQNIVMFEPAGSGKTSLVDRTMISLRSESFSYLPVVVDLFNVRSLNAFYIKFNNALCSLFDDLRPALINRPDMPVSGDAAARILALPEKICVDKNRKPVILFKNFQNTLLFTDYDLFYADLDREWRWHANTSYIVTGNGVNAMKYIFEQKKFFYGLFNTISLSTIPESTFAEYINSMFLKAGKVIDRSQTEEIYRIAGGHPAYVNRLSSLCFDKTLGYMTPDMLKSSARSLIYGYIPVFENIMNDLTENQIWMLRAVFDGVRQFSSSTVLERYHLNSSANVFRLKEALTKKEVIAFDDRDNAFIIDPLFRYWLKNYYFVEF